MSERKFGPFVVGEQIGAGGMGTVYVGKHEQTGQAAAIKVLPASLRPICWPNQIRQHSLYFHGEP